MRKVGWIAVCLVALLSGLVTSLYRRYQIQPLSGYPLDSITQHRKRVEKATSLFCRYRAEPPADRLVIVQLVRRTSEPRPLISINGDEAGTWGQTQERLTQIYSTRADRVLFLVDNTDVDQRYRSELMEMMRKLPVVDDVCVIDPKNPPSWYPADLRMPAVATR